MKFDKKFQIMLRANIHKLLPVYWDKRSLTKALQKIHHHIPPQYIDKAITQYFDRRELLGEPVHMKMSASMIRGSAKNPYIFGANSW
jgi:hypothetical protein